MVFPAYQTALDNLPEEPTPLTLPALQGCFFQPEGMEDDSDRQQREEMAASAAMTTIPQTLLAGPNPTVDPAAAHGPPVTPATNLDGSGPGPVTQQNSAAELSRLAAMEKFIRAPNLRDPTNLAMGEITILLHFLFDSPERAIALSRLLPPQPPQEVQAIWAAWAPHLITNGYAEAFFCGALAGSPQSQEETELMTIHLHDRVKDFITEETLRAYTQGTIEEAAMPQSSTASKRGREETNDTEDTGASSRQPPSSSHAAAIPPPQQEQQEPPASGKSARTLLRENAHMDFLRRPALPAPDKLVLSDISALLALLVEGAANDTVTNLLAAPANRGQAMTIWNAWAPSLSHHPLFPIPEAQVKKEIFKILATPYASQVAREGAAEYLRAYAESALTSAAFIYHTDYTVAEDLTLVRPPPPSSGLL